MAHFLTTSEISAAIRAVTIVHFDIRFDDASATFTIPVKAGTLVHEVGAAVTTAFTSTSPDLVVGDGDDDNGYLQASALDLDLSTATNVNLIVSSAATTNGYRYGRYYPSDDTIDFVWTQGSGTKTAGSLKGFVKLSNVQYDGIPTAAVGS